MKRAEVFYKNAEPASLIGEPKQLPAEVTICSSGAWWREPRRMVQGRRDMRRHGQQPLPEGGDFSQGLGSDNKALQGCT